MMQQKDGKVIIRLAQPQDSAQIVKLQLDSIKTLSAQDYSPSQLQALLDSKSCPRPWDETILVAEIDRQIAGFASLLKGLNVIGAVFVHPNFVRRGIGTKLLKSVEQKAIRNKIKILWVCSSLNAHGFYLANGYKTIQKVNIRHDFLVPVPCIQMKKSLADSICKEQKIELLYKLFTGFVVIILLICIFF